MADLDLRELERRWQATGLLQDEATYLLARVRQGELPRERLNLAACLGHPGSRAAIERVGIDLTDPWSEWLIRSPRADELYSWAAYLAHLDPPTAVRAALGAIRLSERPDPRRFVTGVEAWIVHQEDALLDELLARAEALGDAARGDETSLVFFCQWARDMKDYDPPDWAGSHILEAIAIRVPTERLLLEVCREVAPWLLGEGDPVRIRVAERARYSEGETSCQ